VRVATCSLIVLAVAACWCPGARAECGSWWCPLGCHARTQEPKPGLTQVSNTTTSAKKAGALTKASAGTKRFVANTKNLLSFKKSPPTKRTGTVATHSARPKKDEPGFFHRLFNPEPPPPPKTIEEWMSLKQIHP
jgi:hypothetical protein